MTVDARIGSGDSKWSDLPRRAITIAVALPPLLALAVWAPPWAWAALSGGALAIAGGECVTLLARKTRTGWAWIGGMGSFGAGAALYLLSGSSPATMALQILALLIAAALLFFALRSFVPYFRRGIVFPAVVSVLFAALYCGLLPAHLALLRRDAGSAWALFALAIAWGSDISGYLVGKVAGGTPIAPRISPSKAIAGYLAGIVTAAVIGILFATGVQTTVDTRQIVLIAVVAGLLSQIGDLAESFLKRRCGAKDSGTLIAGHGGMLDCIDGLILAAPWLYYAHRHLQ
jgi:phosphatidate cytidylyltransferase